MGDHTGFYRAADSGRGDGGGNSNVDVGLEIARLQRFYGGDAAQWFDMPLWMLYMYSGAIPQLRAQESLSSVSAQAAAAHPKEMRSYLDKLEQAAEGERGSAPVEDVDPDMAAQVWKQRMLSMGFDVEIVSGNDD